MDGCKNEQGAGALVLCRGRHFNREWILEAVRGWPPQAHGRKYGQRFVSVPIRDCVAWFYEITGYQTQSENVAFEHLFFVIEQFVEHLQTASAPSRFISVVDVGAGQAVEVFGRSGRPLAATALQRFGCTRDDLRAARVSLAQTGLVVWTIGDPLTLRRRRTRPDSPTTRRRR